MSEFKPNGYFVDKNGQRVEIVDATARKKVTALTEEKASQADVNTLNQKVGVLYVQPNATETFSNVTQQETPANGSYLMYFAEPANVKSINLSFSQSAGTYNWQIAEAEEPFADGATLTLGTLHTGNVGAPLVLDGIEISNKRGILLTNIGDACIRFSKTNKVEYPNACIAQSDKNGKLSNVANFKSSGYRFGFESIEIITGETEVSEQEVFINIVGRSGFNTLYGKKMLVLGDSMAAGHTLGVDNSWAAKIGDRNKMTVSNLATNGAYMSNHQFDTKDNSVYQKICVPTSEDYIGDSVLAENDYILVFGGTNDANHPELVDVGENDSSDPTVFKGAINLICQELQNRAPSARIAFITPYMRNSNYANYINAIEEVCAKYAIPVFNNAKVGGICWGNASQMAMLTLGDDLHLNDAGLEYASKRYEAFLRTI